MSHNTLHVPRGRELWLITTLCLYGIQRQLQVGYMHNYTIQIPQFLGILLPKSHAYLLVNMSVPGVTQSLALLQDRSPALSCLLHLYAKSLALQKFKTHICTQHISLLPSTLLSDSIITSFRPKMKADLQTCQLKMILWHSYEHIYK